MSETKTEPAAQERNDGALVSPEAAAGGEKTAAKEGAGQDAGAKVEPEAKAEAPPKDGAEVAGVPESPDKYDVTIPDVGLKDEKGDPFQFDKNDPLVADLRKVAFENKVSQKVVSEFLTLYAKANKANVDTLHQSRAASEAAEQARVKSELAALATKDAAGKEITGEARISGLFTKVNAIVGDGASTVLAAGLINAEVVKVVEKLAERAIGTAAGKEPPKGAATDDSVRGEARLIQLRSAG